MCRHDLWHLLITFGLMVLFCHPRWPAFMDGIMMSCIHPRRTSQAGYIPSIGVAS